jgi:site-specific DNA-methyltransferase (adenine-specific)
LTLLHGDCLDLMGGIADGSVDLILADLPYGTTACKWDSVIPFAPMWAGIKRVLKPRGACVLFGSQPFTSALVMSNPKWFRYEWVWDKNRAPNGTHAKIRPMQAHENIAVFSKDTCDYVPQMEAWRDDEIKRMRQRGALSIPKSALGYQPNVSPGRDTKVARGKYPRSLIRIPAIGSIDLERVHPTQKPIALLEYLVKTYTHEGDTVLDFTMGSGTTGHACGNLGRRFIGIEQDAGYFAIAQERIATAYEPLRHMQVAS